MSDVTFSKCDKCGKSVPNRHDVKGWIRIGDGPFTLTTGLKGGSGMMTHYLSGKCQDYCSWDCFIESVRDAVSEEQAACLTEQGYTFPDPRPGPLLKKRTKR